jgi:hypothetical protein
MIANEMVDYLHEKAEDYDSDASIPEEETIQRKAKTYNWKAREAKNKIRIGLLTIA